MSKRLIAEFEPQTYTQIIFPHRDTDWVEYLEDAQKCFENIINAIIRFQKCLVVCADIEDVRSRFEPNENLHFIEYKTDDTWARDCSALCVEEDGEVKLLDFTFTGWGGKFEASKDNAMTKFIYPHSTTCDMILEGGGVESNGIDTILTTSECMLNKNRNNTLSDDEITQKLKNYFGASKILYLNHGYLAGDDTDSHIDTLARFVDSSTIMYVKCDDENDEHYKELKLMEDELKVIAKENHYKLIALPMTDAVYFEDERIPATYANFLFVNGGVLVPTYGVAQDEEALQIFRDTFKDREIVGINCFELIKQHGSLHCVTMNFAYKFDR